MAIANSYTSELPHPGSFEMKHNIYPLSTRNRTAPMSSTARGGKETSAYGDHLLCWVQTDSLKMVLPGDLDCSKHPGKRVTSMKIVS